MILGADIVTLHRRAVTSQDVYGNDVQTITDLTMGGCSVQPRSSGEDTQARDQVITGLVLYAPADPLITERDEVEYDGRSYEVDGQPGLWRSPDGSISYQQVALRRVTG